MPYHLSRIFVTKNLNLFTLQDRAHNPKALVYITFHHIEFTDFTTAELYLLSVALVLSA